jgi:hypothetical protein
VIKEGQSFKLRSNRVSQIMKVQKRDPLQDEPSFNRDCKAFPNKRVVLVTPNLEYWDMFVNWYNHAAAYLGDNDQLVVVAQDEGVFTKLRNMRNGSTSSSLRSRMALHREEELITKGTALHPYGSQGFNELTGKRPAQILHFLRLGCTVLYSDIDAVWLGNVFQDIAEAGSHDLYITDDAKDNGLTASWYFCTCFLYLQPSPRVQELVQNWTRAVSARASDQGPFNEVLRRDYETRRSIDFAVLPYRAFPPGCSADRFWGQPTMHVLHANYRVGIENKKEFLVKHHAWNSSWA